MFVINPFLRLSEVAHFKVCHAIAVCSIILFNEQFNECIANILWCVLKLNFDLGDWAYVCLIYLSLKSSIVFLRHQALNDSLIIELDYY